MVKLGMKQMPSSFVCPCCVLQKNHNDQSPFPVPGRTRAKMVYSNIGLKVLFLLASSQVASSLLHAPLIYLEMVSDRLTEGEPIKIFCVAPRAHVGAYFYLFMVGQTQPVQMLTAPETQHQVTFLLENATTINTGLYRCQYGLLNRSQLQPSDFSDTVEITVDAFGLSTFPPTFISAFSLSAFAPTGPPMSDCQDPSRVLLIALIVTGVLLLLMTLAMAVLATGCFKERRQKKKELDSCWAEGRGCTTGTYQANGKDTQEGVLACW
uniref:uncharacterized protein LOC130476374 n=1 Tax=Euleptes europaea TaxID=460621 RepID=UPI00254110DE|nr:uncharacterized protein LOC130476374 [Euleptes europaea]